MISYGRQARSLNNTASFREWTGGRSPQSLGSNFGTKPLAFQNWRRIKEAYTPELVARAVGETSNALGRKVRSCIDPFAGSGTTPLTCQFLGVVPTAIEVNPYLADLTESKLTPVDSCLAVRRLGEVLGTSASIDPRAYYSEGPPTFVEPGRNGKYLFSYSVASRLASLLDAILQIPEVAVRRMFRVLLGTAASAVCNATVSGKGRRYRANWEDRDIQPSLLDQQFSEAVRSALLDTHRFAKRATLKSQVVRGDARRQLRTIQNIDLAVFSPPYPNSFDYTDIYNIELWALRYLKERQHNVELRQATLRSHVQIKRDMTSITTIPIIRDAIEEVRTSANLWDKLIPDMIGAYFDDMSLILNELRRIVPPKGRVYIVVGDSRYSGVDVPVAAGLCEVAHRKGFAVVKSELLRRKRTSPQQGGRLELGESLITLGLP